MLTDNIYGFLFLFSFRSEVRNESSERERETESEHIVIVDRVSACVHACVCVRLCVKCVQQKAYFTCTQASCIHV